MDEQVVRLIEAMEARNATLPKMWTLSPAAARERVDAFMAPMNAGGPSMAKQYDVAIPVRRGTVGATVYVPEAAPPISPGLLYLHGGGFVIMSPKTHDRLARELAAGTKTRVVSLDYGLAPEHPYPTAVHDATDTVRWLEQHAKELGIDAARMLIGGDSAGANLAVASMLKLRDDGAPVPFHGALLIYGRYTSDETPSFRAWGDRDLVLSRQVREWFRSHYLARGGDPDDPYVSPLKGKLDGLPPAVLVVGTLDPLQSDSEMLTDKLRQHGVPAELHLFEDGIHGFVQFPMLDMAGAAIRRICGFGTRCLADA